MNEERENREAADAIARLLEKIDAADREYVLRWAHELVGMSTHHMSASGESERNDESRHVKTTIQYSREGKRLGRILTFASIVVAIITWALTSCFDLHAQKLRHTADAIAIIATTEHLAAADYQMFTFINEDKLVRADALNDKEEKQVLALLDYYEYLCTLYAEGVFDRDIVLHLRGEPMKQAYRICREYIKEKRNEQGGRKNLWSRLENLADE